MNTIILNPIGTIHSPHTSAKGTPIQPQAAKNVKATLEIFPEYVEGLKDLSAFSHLILLYHFHEIKSTKLQVKPYMDAELRGVFATRAPGRPNAIGLSVVKLINIEGNLLHIEQADMLDGTPLLDIKPYVPQFDPQEEIRIGWLEKRVNKLKQTKDDGRFC